MPIRGSTPTFTEYSGQRNPTFTEYSGQASPTYSEATLSGSTTLIDDTLVLRGLVIVGRTTTFVDDK